jgi:hypothetical protein
MWILNFVDGFDRWMGIVLRFGIKDLIIFFRLDKIFFILWILFLKAVSIRIEIKIRIIFIFNILIFLDKILYTRCNLIFL